MNIVRNWSLPLNLQRNKDWSRNACRECHSKSGLKTAQTSKLGKLKCYKLDQRNIPFQFQFYFSCRSWFWFCHFASVGDRVWATWERMETVVTCVATWDLWRYTQQPVWTALVRLPGCLHLIVLVEDCIGMNRSLSVSPGERRAVRRQCVIRLCKGFTVRYTGDQKPDTRSKESIRYLNAQLMIADQCVVMLSQDSFYRGLTPEEKANVLGESVCLNRIVQVSWMTALELGIE